MADKSAIEAYRFNVEMDDSERRQVVQEHLTAAEQRFKEATGADHLYFGVQAAAYYAEWLCLLAPSEGVEFLQALAGLHGVNDPVKYRASVDRLKRAKMALHVQLRLGAEERASAAAQQKGLN
jgi:hypothetical protein